MEPLYAAEAVGLAHAASADPRLWRNALGALARALGAETAALGLRDADGGEHGALCPVTDAAIHARYSAEAMQHTNYLWQAAAAAPAGTALPDEAIAARAAYHRSAIYQGFIRPQGIDAVMTLTLEHGAAGAALAVVGRASGRRRFDADDAARGGRLAAMIGAAASASAAMFAGQRDRIGAATFVCDAAGRVVHASGRAETLLAEGTARLALGVLGIPGAPGLGPAIVGAARPHGGWPPPVRCDLRTTAGLAIRVAPWMGAAGDWMQAEPLALVIVERESRRAPAARLAARHGLTARETAIVLALAEGQTLRAAADAQGIALSTARTHLQHVFDKTGARSQNALIARLAPGSWPDPGG